MSLNIVQLRKLVGDHYEDLEQIDESIVRFTKKAEGRAFAVCYLDITDQLPRTLESLTRYQDRVIGKRYFEDGKSIQWNNYVYFVTTKDLLAKVETRQAKELIEQDRTYARKFVISEEELDSILNVPVIEIAADGHRLDVASLWMGRLAEAGLDEAITADENLPSRLALIEESKAAPTRTNLLVPKDAEKAPAFIRSLKLTRFRKFPLQREFDFGTINLIFGANATGKTSLLEAIELFYCGRNKRNPDEDPIFELDAVLDDGRNEKASSDRTLQEYRNRNLQWYGVSEIKTAKLYASFSKFNFLDADAAVSLAESTAHVEEDLARLLIGADASKIWETINRVDEAVSTKLNDLRALEQQTAEEILALQNRIIADTSVKQESESIRARLEQMTDRLGWRGTVEKNERFAASLLETLTEMISVAQQATALGWTSSPLSIDGLVAYCRDARITSGLFSENLNRLEESQRSQKNFADTLQRERRAVELGEQAKRIVEAGVTERIAERTRHQTEIATQSSILAGLDLQALTALAAAISPDTTVELFDQRAIATSLATRALLAKQKKEYEDFTKLRTKSLSLIQELRATAGRVLENTSTPDRCPLCHTQFENGELEKHINWGVDESEAAAQKLLSQLQRQEKIAADAVAVEKVISQLKGFCQARRLSLGISVASAVIEVQNLTKILTEAQARTKALDEELRSLAAQGFSSAKLDELMFQLGHIGFRIAEPSREACDAFLATLRAGLTTSIQSLETRLWL